MPKFLVTNFYTITDTDEVEAKTALEAILISHAKEPYLDLASAELTDTRAEEAK